MQSYQSETSHSSHTLKHSERGMLNFNTSELAKHSLNVSCFNAVLGLQNFSLHIPTYLLTYLFMYCILCLVFLICLPVHDNLWFLLYREIAADRQRHRSAVHPSVRFLRLGSAAEQNSSFTTSSGSIRSSASSLRARQWQEEYFRRTGGRRSLRITTGEISQSRLSTCSIVWPVIITISPVCNCESSSS